MKIQAKLFIILMLFLGFSVVSELESYADSSSNIPYVDIVKAEVERRLPEEYDSYCFINQYNSTNDYNYYSIIYYNSDSSIVSTSDGCYVFSANLLSDVKSFQSWRCCYSRSDRDFSYFSLSMTNNFLPPTNGNYYVFELNRYFTNYVECVSNRAIYSSNATQESLIGKFYDDLSFINGEGEGDKLNLYELNLTDLDYNNQVHKFNIATYTNSPCYDEIMEYYNRNCQYAIYLTDYERILTYQNYDDDNSFLYGSYTISGYIDYLITDKSFFYYSEYYSQIMSNSGNTTFNKEVEDYTKRFYFKLVYSEDSNDPHATIWSDNGNLFSIDYLENFENRYFVGSSQTIYYAKEDSKGKFKDLTKDIYYLGYLNPTGGKTRDISQIPFYVYNFDFAGGATELYIVNQNDYDYEQMINNRYDNWNDYYDEWTIITDGSIGDSYFQGNDFSSSTFEKGTVTDDTSTEDDESHIGEIRTPFDDVDVIDNKKETEAGIADGSIISNLINTIKSKFDFSNNIINNANEIKDYIINTQETHKYYLNINHKYLSGNVCIIDLSWYEPYKPTVDAFICAFAYLAFTWHIFCKIPELIRGASATSYVSDIQAYSQTGFGRSSSIHKGGF